MKIIASMLFAIALTSAGWAVEVREQDHVVSIANAAVSVSYDLAQGTYSASDVRRGKTILSDATTKLGQWSSAGAVNSCIVEPLGDALGLGKSVLITSAVAGGPKLLLRISLYDDAGCIALAAGLDNTTGECIQLKDIVPLEGAAFAGGDLQQAFSLLDGFSGGAKTYVTHDGRKRKSLNNMLATFGGRGASRSLVLGGLSYAEFEKYAEVERGKTALAVRLGANDPVGKRIDPGMRYLVAQDRFYVDFLTDNPFDALEAYANAIRLAQPVVLPVCRFPIVDTWFAQVPHFGGGEDKGGYRAQNDSVGAVEEMECVARSGFLNYAQVGILIEPDLYDLNNQQGWWDDAHWQRGPSNRAKKAGTWVSSHGQFVPPYETARTWCGAIKALGGVPMIYVQTGFRSQDYAEKFPEHMLFNATNAPHVNEKGEQLYRDKGKKEPRKLGYDYTDPGFIRHVREVWETLRLAGLQGVKFDYPDFPFTGWPTRGGMEDKYATTAMHYRNIFRLAQEGLGPDCYLHERALDRGSDVTLGLVTSQRTEGDTDNLNPGMVSRVGLRWYKNRTVLNYDMDGKNPFHAVPANRDGERAMLTMSYVAAGTLMIVPSFGRMTGAQIHDLSRLYPFHATRQSARPVDAFTSAHPRIYDYKVSAQWHQLTFYNTDATNSVAIAVELAGDTASGALGLDPAKQYFVYDFWSDALLGKFAGGQKFEQTLRPGEARMMAVHEVAPHPQFLSTDRHVMQGLVDLTGCVWDEKKHQLRGVANVIGGEPYRITIATNGQKPLTADVDATIETDLARSGLAPVRSTATLRPHAKAPELVELILNRPSNGPVAWSVNFP